MNFQIKQETFLLTVHRLFVNRIPQLNHCNSRFRNALPIRIIDGQWVHLWASNQILYTVAREPVKMVYAVVGRYKAHRQIW